PAGKVRAAGLTGTGQVRAAGLTAAGLTAAGLTGPAPDANEFQGCVPDPARILETRSHLRVLGWRELFRAGCYRSGMTEPDRLPGDQAPLDAVDRALLRELIADPRLPVIELAKRVGVVRATAAARIDKLTRRGVIGPGGIALDVTALGYPLTAYVGLQIRQGHGPEVRAWLETFPEVL